MRVCGETILTNHLKNKNILFCPLNLGFDLTRHIK